jgi:putative transposase
MGKLSLVATTVAVSRPNIAKRRRPAQLKLPFLPPPPPRKHGGARAGAGRKPGVGRTLVRHRSRAPLSAAHPVHVVLRSRFRPLRSPFVFPTLRRALAHATRAHPWFRVVQFSVQHDHLHLIVEARDALALSRGVQGLAIRVARAVNRLVSRRGKVWAGRFFSRALTSPRSVRNALAYVLNNFRKHRAAGRAQIDPYSSAPYFSGFRELGGRSPLELPATAALPHTPRGLSPPQTPGEFPITRAKTWLAREGWQRAGRLSFSTRTSGER